MKKLILITTLLFITSIMINYAYSGEKILHSKIIGIPGYWELYAQFYYRETTTPEYCRYYTRPEHALRSFGKMCLKTNGEWEVQ